jgi:hypothetical protein
MRTMRWSLAVAVVLTAGVLPGEAARTTLEDTRWDLSGRAVITGVARSGRVRVPFREGRPIRIDAEFPTSTAFSMQDGENRVYTGTYGLADESLGFALDPDDATEETLNQAVADWIEDLTGSPANAVSSATEWRLTVRRGRMRLMFDRKYGATTLRDDQVRGHYRIRASGYEQSVAR